jgi:tRNA G18 (ribose-2'-O)-methylase SpoU
MADGKYWVTGIHAAQELLQKNPQSAQRVLQKKSRRQALE